MVELDIVNDRELRQIRHELGLFVEERRVVLVALDHEVIAVGNAKALAEVLHDTADEKGRGEPPDLADPRGKARCRRLSMRTCDDQRPAAADELLANGLSL